MEKPRHGGFMRILYSLRANEFDKYYLTFRERQVANGILDGERASTIANSLFLSESCVRYHMSNIYRKAKVSTRQEFTRKIRAGIDRSTDPCH